ncbi:MAG: GWxTD domain-containing protein [Bacteroidetes bacterium]|nr:GWxTD domain-containing protein [Bacteroidota bacterium]
MRRSLPHLVVFVVCLAAFTRVHAQDSTFNRNNFQYDVVSFRLGAATDSVRTDIYIAVPYSFLFFQNAVDKYVADYRVSIEIRDSTTDSIVFTHSNDNSVVVPTVVMEKLRELDQSRADASQQRVHLASGHTYVIHLAVNDLSKRDHAAADITLHTPSFSAAGLAMSSVLLFRSHSGARMVPNIGEDATDLTPVDGGAFFEIYNAPQSTPLWVVHVLTDVNGAEVSRHVEVLVPDGTPRQSVFTKVIDDDLWSGSYRLRTYIVANVGDTADEPNRLEEVALVKNRRRLRINGGHGIPLVSNDLDEAIDQLTIISYGGSYDSLVNAHTSQEKRRAIREFWDKMNVYRGQVTTRPMEVFYRRVRYAISHYTQGMQGWRSDRGRMYIIYGEPTSIDRNTYSAGQKPYELWTYYDLNLRFYFVDQFLMNDYRLNGPFPAAGTFYWERDGQ